MTEGESFFIQILKNHIIGEASMIPEIENWDEIWMLSQSHQVTGIIFAQCKDVIPKSLLPIFRQAYSVAFYYYANRVDVMEHLFKELEGMGRKNKKPNYSKKTLMQEITEKLVKKYGTPFDDRLPVDCDHVSIRDVTAEFGITILKARKILITAGVYTTVTSREV